MTTVITEFPARTLAVQGEEMLQPDEVAAMVRLHELGWGAKRLSKEFGCARNTVRRYLRAGGVVPFAKPARKSAFDGLDDWLRERFFRHGGNADVVRQELASEHGIVIGLRSVELRVQRWRRELKAQKRATVRFETRPGHQLQIDFGESKVWIGDERVRVHLFVATLGYSRRMHIRPSIRERQVDWFEGMEGAFLRFGGVPAEILFDNARALVEHHDAATREVRFNGRLHAFARYWGFSPRACAPYRARTKGKDERGVGYVKRNAIAGRRFASWGAFVAHLEQWNREIADVRVHGTTGELPLVRFADEAAALRPLGGRAPFGQLRDLVRKVRPDCAIDLDTNSYSVPWRLVGETVQVVVLAGRVIVRHAGEVVADHPVCDGRRQRVVDRAHLAGLVGTGPFRVTASPPTPPPALLRPLAEYEAVVGGGW
ncbi:Integrase, catalytic region (plasmid) [Rhizorhabdus wittichii RW1]|jgi:transposase|uniref:Integrase, catalytic region n=1 Tax=Rhizorhabdus wittichii (strain DSM 6014 / CCUG 31198 / JCM 15750 / NBRC 105917 / EY 4224 / RW1) TaxID=392499 RepID=A0A9J9HH32_RHIWR|nr:Integrase, catalytic region [Rhizorhabdus wittichii RW1]